MQNQNIRLIAIDDGGYSTAVVTRDVEDMFPSVKSIYGNNRKLTEIVGKHDFIVEYKGNKYVAGTLAQFDSSLPVKMFDESKAHEFFDLSVLISVFLYGGVDNVIIVSVPVDMHTPEEKKARIERLQGTHTMTINNKSKTFYISKVAVAAEGASAYWVNELYGWTKYLDIGSRTVNYASVYNDGDSVRYIDTQSGTFHNKGIEALDKEFDAKGLADYICGRLFSKGWKLDDDIFLLGGGSLNNDLVNEIKRYFPKSKVMEKPLYANAIGMYNLGRYNFGIE